MRRGSGGFVRLALPMSRMAPLLPSLLLAACAAGPPAPTSAAPAEPPADEPMSVPLCHLDADAAERVLGQAVDAADEHLTWMPIAGFRTCVFFDGNDFRADVSVRQAETGLDDAARLMDQLGDALRGDEQVDVTGEVGQPARAYGYCVSQADCTLVIAVVAPPNFFVVRLPDNAGAHARAIALARSLLSP